MNLRAESSHALKICLRSKLADVHVNRSIDKGWFYMSTYDDLVNARREVRRDEQIRDAKMKSGIRIPTTAEQQHGAYKSAQEIAEKIGADGVWHAVITVHVTIHGSDYWDDYDDVTDIHFYAYDKADAEDRLSQFNKEGQHRIVGQETKEEAERCIADYVAAHPHCKECERKILYLPTSKMVEEMNKSVDWAVNILKKMRDKDEADRRIAWLQSPEGQAWTAKYEADKALVDKLQQKEDARIARRRAKEQAEEDNSQDIEDILAGRSTKFPQYNAVKVAPVEVNGGRKFRGKGFVMSTELKSGSFSYGRDESEWTDAKIYVPSTGKTEVANVKYCKVDPSVSAQECVDAFEKYSRAEIVSVMNWCQSKRPNASHAELASWAMNVIKKHHPEIPDAQIKNVLGITTQSQQDAAAAKVKSTVNWAIGLGEPQLKTERIIAGALRNKGIDWHSYKDIIVPAIQNEFGNPKIFI